MQKKKTQIFYPEYMERRRPKTPRSICGNGMKRLMGIVSPSLCWIVAAGGKGEAAAKELAEYNRKMERYLCYKRRLNKERWKALYREYRKEGRGMRNFRLGDESRHQEALFSWTEYQMGRMPELEYMYHIPNGGKRDAATATALKRQGVKAGVPDIHLPVARGEYHGMYIELKAGRNTTTDNQKRWLEYLRQQGYFTAVCYGWQIAAELIETYLLHTAELGEAGQIWKL